MLVLIGWESTNITIRLDIVRTSIQNVLGQQVPHWCTHISACIYWAGIGEMLLEEGDADRDNKESSEELDQILSRKFGTFLYSKAF